MLPRKAVRSLLLPLLLGSTLTMGATITFFQAADSNTMRVTWDGPHESSVPAHHVSRKTSSDPAFNRLATVLPGSQPHYQYLDTNGHRGAQGAPFAYRPTVRTTTDAQTYSSTLSHAPSAVQRSWGSIKSMFR